MRWAVIVLLLGLPGCWIKAGSFEAELWRGFNIDLNAGPLGTLCLGCLESESAAPGGDDALEESEDVID